MLFEVLAFLITFVALYKFIFGPQDKKPPNKVIPGLEPSDPIDGNKSDIKKAGSIIDFIKNMHKKYGPIFRFYDGKNLSVSLASPEMLKQTRHLFEAPTDLFEQFTLLIGRESISFSSIDEIKRRRKVYEQHFMMGACKVYSDKFKEITKETAERWVNTTQPLPLMKSTARYSLNSLLRCCFGDAFKNEKAFEDYQELVDFVFRHIEPLPKEGTDLYNELVTKCNKIKEVIQKIMDERRGLKHDDDDDELFIDVLLNMDMSEEARKGDFTAFISGGYFTVAMLLCWCLCEISRHPEVQEKIFQERVSELGDEELTVENMGKLIYLRQVIDETLRIYVSSGITGRISDTDLQVGGYHIPKRTRIYHAFDPLFNDPKVWKDPKTFDPDRFSREKSRGRNPLSFKPFGFAGKRMCPGMSFALSEMIMMTSEVIRCCRLDLVPGQTIEMMTGFIMAPKNEIMVTFEKR